MVARSDLEQSLSLYGCSHIDDEEVQHRNETWGIKDCTLPSCSPSPMDSVEVDPAYK